MSITQNSEPPEGQIVTLSEAELDQCSGGFVNVSFTLLIAEDSHEITAQEMTGDGYSGSSISGERRRSHFGLQFTGTFKSMGHFNSFLSRFNNFFGSR